MRIRVVSLFALLMFGTHVWAIDLYKPKLHYTWPSMTDYIELPVESYGDRTLIVINIDKAKPLRLMFDVSAGKTGIYSHRWLELVKAGIVESDSDEIDLTIGKLAIRQLDAERIHCDVCPDYDGVIGQQLLQYFSVLWSAAKPRVRLYKPKDPAIVASGRVHRMYIESGRPAIEAKFFQDDESKLRARLYLDTANSLPLTVTANASSLKWIQANGFKTSVYSDGQERAIGQIPRWQWEYIGINNVPVQIAGPEEFSEPISGAVGAELLSRFELLFDYYGQRLVIKNQPKLKQPLSINLSGISLFKTESGSFYVKSCDIEVCEQLKVGDEIDVVGRQKATDISMATMLDILSKNYRVKLCRKTDQVCESIEISHSLPSLGLTGVEG